MRGRDKKSGLLWGASPVTMNDEIIILSVVTLSRNDDPKNATNNIPQINPIINGTKKYHALINRTAINTKRTIPKAVPNIKPKEPKNSLAMLDAHTAKLGPNTKPRANPAQNPNIMPPVGNARAFRIHNPRKKIKKGPFGPLEHY